MIRVNQFLTFRLWMSLLLLMPWPLARLQAADNPSAKWEKEISAFEAADKTNPPPAHPYLFIGSSSIRIWKTLAEDFKEVPVLNRGFGGSQMEDSAFFVERIVLPYRPRQILVYAGDNDLASGKAPEEVLSAFKTFVGKVHASQPEVPIAYISIKPSPSRWHLQAQVRSANRLIADFVQGDPLLRFIDVFSPMLGPNGRPRAELFLADRLHMNAAGYALWTGIIRPQLQR
jgi:lysophospholipase L1-like esterase